MVVGPRSLHPSPIEADPMSSDTPAPSRGFRSCLVPIGVCLAISAGIAALLYPAVRASRRAVNMSVVT
jgi:hypothetical protein